MSSKAKEKEPLNTVYVISMTNEEADEVAEFVRSLGGGEMRR